MSDVRISRVGAWQGGTVVDLASYEDTVLAATFAGVFRSTDRGQNWQPVGRDLPDWFIQAVALARPAAGLFQGRQVLGAGAEDVDALAVDQVDHEPAEDQQEEADPLPVLQGEELVLDQARRQHAGRRDQRRRPAGGRGGQAGLPGQRLPGQPAVMLAGRQRSTRRRQANRRGS
mgnify:CR=1 FL=1